MAISDVILPEFDQEMANTRKTLERVPEDKFGWKPHEKSFSMGDLSTHIVRMVGWTKPTLEDDHYDLATWNPEDNKPAATTAELLAMFDKLVAEARASLAKTSDDEMQKPWSLKKGEQVFFTMPKIATLRGFVLNHIVHHRGQLTVYLRLNNVPVPALYGPSADEQN